MQLTHSFTVPASVEETWQTFMDLEEVGGCFPGATVTEVTDEGFSGTVKVKLGPISLVYAGSGAFVERDDGARRAVIEAKGKDKRGNGTAGATVTIQLADAGSGSTRADVETDLSVTGKPAQFGRGVMQDVSDKLLQQFIRCIEDKMAAPGKATVAEPAAPEESAAVEPAPTTESAAGAGPPAASVPGAVPDSPAPEPGPRTGGPVTAQDAAVDAEIPATRVSPAGAPAARTSAAGQPGEALDLGRTVVPVLLKSYGRPVAIGLGVLLILVGLARRRRR